MYYISWASCSLFLNSITFFLPIYYRCTFCACCVIQLFLTKIYQVLIIKVAKLKETKSHPIPPPFKNKIKCVLVNILNCSVKWFNTPFEVLKSFFSISVRYHNEILRGRNSRYEHWQHTICQAWRMKYKQTLILIITFVV